MKETITSVVMRWKGNFFVAFRRVASVIVIAVLAQAQAPSISSPAPHTRWYESAAALRNVSLKDNTAYPQFPLDPAKAGNQLRVLKEQGFTGIQVFAPADGGRSYNGLDSRDHFRIEPKYGSIADFKRMVQIAHSLNMPVVIFNNLGYSAVDAPSFLKACDDVRNHRESPEVHWFFWSDSKDAPPPATGDRYFLVRPAWLVNYRPEERERWVYNDRAQRYYWTRWPGKDDQGNIVDLPQYNWASPEWQQEAEKIVRFWMNSGIDGMVVDAVNWYVGYTWEIGHRRITDVINSYGDKYSQPEGGGGFQEDPVAWISEGGWTSVQDYGLSTWWAKPRMILENAIEAGDPRSIEESLRSYHDPVVAARGTVNFSLGAMKAAPQKQLLATAILAATGHLITDWSHAQEPIGSDLEVQWLFKTKAAHPALYQLGSRRKLPTNNDARYYAFLRTASDQSERVLVVTNFWATPQDVTVDLSGVRAQSLTDIRSGAKQSRESSVTFSVPPLGYRFFTIQ